MAVPVTNKTDAESEFDDSKPWRPLKILVDSGLERKNKAEDFKDCSKESKQETNTEIPLSEIQNEEGAITSENADSEIEYESADEGDNSDGQQMEVDGESNSSDAMDSLKLQDDQGDKSTTMEEGEESKPQSPEKSPSQGEPEQEEQVIEEQEEQVIEMKLQSIREQSQKARDLADRVLEFSGKKTDKEYLFLSEMLLRGILTLDEIETQGVETVKQARRGAVREIQGYLDKLEEKVS
ncbi:predicted protein [Nematostella vectensis]|uniref:BAG domain-containing protein n=1 Tax=Nematostella vectensis TaxID=45351 RepID=A7RG52_NEMVE|nr:predicted protein [Nematostella vectensis]|eukprot:XP_001641534.1 predicted protein [Nematostella vectensis]